GIADRCTAAFRSDNAGDVGAFFLKISLGQGNAERHAIRRGTVIADGNRLRARCVDYAEQHKCWKDHASKNPEHRILPFVFCEPGRFATGQFLSVIMPISRDGIQCNSARAAAGRCCGQIVLVGKTSRVTVGRATGATPALASDWLKRSPEGCDHGFRDCVEVRKFEPNLARAVVIVWLSFHPTKSEQTCCLGTQCWAFFFSPRSVVSSFGW